MADSGALEPDELEETQIFSANEGDVRKMTLKGGFYFPLSPTTSPAPNEEKKWSMDEAEVRPRARTGSGLDGVTAERIVLKVMPFAEAGQQKPNTYPVKVERNGCTLKMLPVSGSKPETLHVETGVNECSNAVAYITCSDQQFFLGINAGSAGSSDTDEMQALAIGGTGAYLRLNPEQADRQWTLKPRSVFKIGSTDFTAMPGAEKNTLELHATGGPLDGKTIIVPQSGATIGRATQKNLIHCGDAQLSRYHAAIDFKEELQEFCLRDLGSTNGTYISLSGPYSEPYCLCLGDQVLAANAALSIDRFDFGVVSEIGMRATQEDAHMVLQDMCLEPFTCNGVNMRPQSFLGVFDGHGGSQASSFLGAYLHRHLTTDLMKALGRKQPDREGAEAAGETSGEADKEPVPLNTSELDEMVHETLLSCFARVDAQFIAESEKPEAGSTCISALLLGDRLYVANVGDSRAVIGKAPEHVRGQGAGRGQCSAGGSGAGCFDALDAGEVFIAVEVEAVAMSSDQKPTREDEAKRIRDAGGFVIQRRVMGELAVSRAFGDAEYKVVSDPAPSERAGGQAAGSSVEGGRPSLELSSNESQYGVTEPLVIAKPEIETRQLGSDDWFLLLACDGLFDVFTNEDAAAFIGARLAAGQSAQQTAEQVVIEAIQGRGSRDNVTCVLSVLQ
jgi:serine/threonine protein phosphatase PrpC